MDYKTILRTAFLLLGVLSFGTPSITHAQNSDQSYDVKCVVVDDRDGDTSVTKHEGVFSKKDQKTWVKKDFTVRGSSNKLVFFLVYEPEDDLVYLGINDKTKEIHAQTVDHDPESLYVFLGTKDVGVYADCQFELID